MVIIIRVVFAVLRICCGLLHPVSGICWSSLLVPAEDVGFDENMASLSSAWDFASMATESNVVIL